MSRHMSFVHDMVHVCELEIQIRRAAEDQQESEEHRARVAEHETLRLRLQARRYPFYRNLPRFELLRVTNYSVRLGFRT